MTLRLRIVLLVDVCMLERDGDDNFRRPDEPGSSISGAIFVYIIV